MNDFLQKNLIALLYLVALIMLRLLYIWDLFGNIYLEIPVGNKNETGSHDNFMDELLKLLIYNKIIG